MSTADLIGYGRLTWDQLLATIAGAQAAWADYEGFHVGAAPQEPPPYSHLWAWTEQWLLRARIDGAGAITGALALTAEPQAAAEPKLREQVSYQRLSAHTWPADEKRIGPLDPHIAGRPVSLYVVAGPSPVTFAALPG